VGTRLYLGLRFESVEHIPLAGPLIIAPIHVTTPADPALVSIPVRQDAYTLSTTSDGHVTRSSMPPF
jgi:hypothetical protein